MCVCKFEGGLLRHIFKNTFEQLYFVVIHAGGGVKVLQRNQKKRIARLQRVLIAVSVREHL